MPIEVQGLSAVRGLLDRLRRATRAPQVLIDLPDTEEQKIEWLVKGKKNQVPRDVLQTTPKLIAAMVTAFTSGLAKVVRGADKDTPWRMAGEVYLKTLQDRIGFSGGDLHGKLAPLKPSTIAKKKGSTRMFYDSGDLYKALLKAKVRVSR